MSTPDSLARFTDTLCTLFQFDVADLDFGVYRILNEKRDDIERFIERDLVVGVREELRAYEEGQIEAAREAVKEARQTVLQTLSEDAILPDGSIKEAYRELKAAQDYIKARKRLETAELSEDTERRIYDDLARFFNRYYDGGDFITKRRFAAGDSKYMRRLVGRTLLDVRVHRRALQAFLTEEVFNTRDRTGILLFVSLREHRIEVLGDTGINAQVPPEAWADVVATLRHHIKTAGDLTAGLVDAIEQCGRLLERKGVAIRPDDTDELSNRVRTPDANDD